MSKQSSPAQARRRRLLVVEDEPDIAAVYRLIFDPTHFVVTVAGDLAAAKRALQATPPDLLILDLGLPDGDGLILCRELKSTAPRLPVLIVSAHAHRHAEARAAGADLFLPKPFDPDQLEATVRRFLT